MYDLLVRGGHVIDPASGLDGPADVAVSDGRIAQVAPALDAAQAREVLDVAGQYVTPGLVDLHTHIYWGVTYWGIEADPVAARSGVTTWLHVGSAGAYSFPGFRRFIAEGARARIFCLLNVSAIGLIAPTWELSNLDYCDVGLAARSSRRTATSSWASRPASTATPPAASGSDPLSSPAIWRTASGCR